MRHIYRNLWFILTVVILGACGQAQVIPTAISIPTAAPTATSVPTNTPQAVTNETLEQARPALVRIVNAAVDSPPLNVFVGFSAFATNLAYTQFTEPTSVDAGTVTVKIQASGSASNDKPLLESDLTFKSGDSILVLVTGSKNQLALTVLPDKNEALKEDESIIHVINGLSDGSSISLKNKSTDLANGVGSRQTILTPLMPVGKTDLTFQIGDKTSPYTTTLKGQTNTTLIVAGNTATPSIIQFDRQAPKRIGVRAINASADITSVDVYIDDLPLSNKAEYGRPTERQNAASGQHTVRFYTAGADRSAVEPLTGQVVSLLDGDDFSVVLLGSASKLSILAFSEDRSPLPEGSSRLAFLNTIPTLPEIDVQAKDVIMPDLRTLSYGQAPVTTTVQAGNYSFVMNAANSQNVRVTVENPENIQFEGGYNYLYLVTGRTDNKPLIISEKIESTGTTNDLNTQNTDPTAKVRFINAVDGQPLDFKVNAVSVLTGLKYGEGSSLISIRDQSATLAVNITGQEEAIGQQETTFETGSSYSVVAYRAQDKSIGMLVINDDNLIFDGSSPHLRLINVSASENSSLGLAFSAPNKNPNPTIEPAVTPEATQDPTQPNVVYTLPYGIQKLVDKVSTSSASSVVLMPTGIFDLQMIQSKNNKMGITIPKVALDEGNHIDIIAYEEATSDQIKAFTVLYPKPQA